MTRQLLYPYFGLHRVDWVEGDDRGTEFNLPTSEWMRLFDDVGFDVLDFHEIRSPLPDAGVKFHIGADWGARLPFRAGLASPQTLTPCGLPGDASAC